MIAEVLKDVKNAESRAEEIIAAAENTAAEIRLAADRSYAEIIENAKLKAKKDAAEIIEEAERVAQEAFDEAAKSCKGECEKMKVDLDGKINEFADEVFGRIKG